MVSIHVTNVTREGDAAKFVAAVAGKTYMDFRVTLCPFGGSWRVNVETDYTDDEAEATRMLLMLLFDSIGG